MLAISCGFIGICLLILGSSCNGVCVLVFLRKKFRYRLITPYFIVLLFANSIYLLFRLMKLPYYSATVFQLETNIEKSCPETFLARIYGYITQNWPQALVPLVHPDTYIRFSLILMSIMSVQRTLFITRSLKFFILLNTFKDTYKYQWTIFIILTTFLIAYTFEFAGLTLFCSESNNRNITYSWFIYMNTYMKNATFVLTNTMSDQPNALKCVNYAIDTFQENQTSFVEKNPVCTKEELIDILSNYFDVHITPIVNLIRKIHSQTGDPISRDEIRRKYHFHDCLFKQEPNFFHRHYDFMYSRTLNLNRYTLLLVFGSIIPSLITIFSNIISIYRVRELNRLTSICISPCRRRTDDTRRILFVITVECLFAILNSWFGDIILSLVSCKRKTSAGNDCPAYFSKNIKIIVMLDMIYSVSNIILHCLCGKCFRNELQRMLKSSFDFFKHQLNNIWCCYCQIHCTSVPKDQYITFKLSTTQRESSISSNSVAHNHLYSKSQSSTTPNSKYCCDCRWYCSRKQLVASQQDLQKDQTHYVIRYGSLTQRTYITRATQANSMRLYHPKLQTKTQRDTKYRYVDSR